MVLSKIFFGCLFFLIFLTKINYIIKKFYLNFNA